MSTPDITSVEMTRSFAWLRLISQCVIALLLFVAANVYTYETSGFFQKLTRRRRRRVQSNRPRERMAKVNKR